MRRRKHPLDLLVHAAAEMGAVHDLADALTTACRLGAALVRGRGAVLHLEGPGLLVTAGRWGDHPEPVRGELAVDGRVERVLRSGVLETDVAARAVYVPVRGEAGVVGVLAVAGVPAFDLVDADVLRIHGSIVGSALDRFGAHDAGGWDPVSGVGDHHRAASAVASLRPGDAVVVCALDGPADDHLQGHLGLHLRRLGRLGDAIARFGPDGFVVVARQLRRPVDDLARSITATWALAPTVSAGAALHVDGAAPADTVELARRMLAAAQAAGPGRVFVAAARHRPA